MPTLAQARAVLQKTFGYPDFRGAQPDAIRTVLSGRDVLVVMPTGGGKSLCYQVPALLLPGLTLVVSPLISLMKDQVEVLERKGVAAALLNSTLTPAEMQHNIERAKAGQLRMLYTAPERFESERFARVVAELNVSLLAIDEAHCISEWGRDFRPAYRRLGPVRDRLNCPVIALTATATPEVRLDIVDQLRLRKPRVLVRGFDRPNLSFHVIGAKNVEEKDALLIRLVKSAPKGSIVVYGSTRKRVEALADLLNRVSIRAAAYHAGLPSRARASVQDAFMKGDVRLVVATNAFGMGVDKADVRRVVHYEMPATLEGYYQEAGRAGRDGAPSDCVLLHAYRDRFTHRFLIEQSHPSREVLLGTLRALEHVAEGDVARVDLEALSRTVVGARGERNVEAALRILAELGAVRAIASSPGPPWVRMIATPDRIRLELPDDSAARTTLRALWRLGGADRLYAGCELRRRDLARLGADDLVAATMEELRQRGFLDWRQWPRRPGFQLLRASGDAGIDWRHAEVSAEAELRRLAVVQSYAYQRGCRRAFLLRYFGDPAASRRCGGCDNCSGPAGALLPGTAAPSKARSGALLQRVLRPLSRPRPRP